MADWRDIRTSKQLKAWLLREANEIRRAGHPVIATKWEDRVKRMPLKMKREAINTVLLSATWERDELLKKK